MKTYKIKVAIPSTKNAWEASVEERMIDAENFNYMIMKALTVDELRSGARIIRIEEEMHGDRGLAWKIIKYC